MVLPMVFESIRTFERNRQGRFLHNQLQAGSLASSQKVRYPAGDIQSQAPGPGSNAFEGQKEEV